MIKLPSRTKHTLVVVACLIITACIKLPNPPPAVPPLKPCAISGLPSSGSSKPITGGGNYVGGTAIISTPIQLREGGSDLVVVMRDDLDIKANILFPKRMNQNHSRSLNITLVSLRGTVSVAPGVKIGSGKAAPGPNGSDKLAAGDGVQGGNIKLYGVNLDIKGALSGNEGGEGGEYSAAGGRVSAWAGKGGNGGSIGLCASETIYLASGTAGQGGGGGNKVVAQDWTQVQSGSFAGIGGNILMYGKQAKGPKLQITVDQAVGGKGGIGGSVQAVSFMMGSLTGLGALAHGGNGGTGGTVKFQNAEVNQYGVVAAGDGHRGGAAVAHAGSGEHAGRWSGPVTGGSASAFGGTGGTPGSIPDIPLPNNQKAKGRAGRPGGGGTAVAVSGAGGNGNASYPTGASSGTALAAGGPNGLNIAKVPAKQLPANPPVGITGGARIKATQTGN